MSRNLMEDEITFLSGQAVIFPRAGNNFSMALWQKCRWVQVYARKSAYLWRRIGRLAFSGFLTTPHWTAGNAFVQRRSGEWGMDGIPHSYLTWDLTEDIWRFGDEC